MRLHRLELTAIGPFADSQLIDFDELTASGLFLLDGPTGAGKTTVLDAITFALYGPGERNGDGRLRSDFAPRERAPHVRLEFSLRGVRQRISRSPEFERPKRRGDGTTRQAAQAHLERFEGGTWVSRSSNKAEIAEMLADDLGLTRDQFTQVVLLPQGDFARFLRASDDDRRSLLTKLFGTGLYDRITDELERQGQVATRDLEAAASRVRSCVSAAGEAAGLSGADREQLCDLDVTARSARLLSLADDLAAAATAARCDAAAATSHHLAAQARSAAARSTVERIERFRVVVAASAEHEQSRTGFDEARRRLGLGRRAALVRGSLEALDDAECAVAAAEATVHTIDDAIELADIVDTGVESYARHAVELVREAAELQHLAEGERELDQLRQALDAAEAASVESSTEVTRLAQRLDELPAEIDATTGRLEVARAALAAAVEARAQLPGLERRLAAACRLAELAPARSAAQGARTAAIATHQRAVDAHQLAVEARLRGMAAELAGRLHDGEPCPVCGASTHPQPAEPRRDAVTAVEVETAATRRADTEAARELAESTLVAIDTEIASCRAVAGVSKADDLARSLDDVVALVRSAGRAEADVDTTEREHAGLLGEQRRAVSAHTSAIAVQVAAQTQAASLTERVQVLAAAVADARGDAVSVAARQEQLREHAARAERLADAGRTLRAASAHRDAALTRAGSEAVAAGFATIAEVRAAAITAAQTDGLQQLVDAWQDEAERLRTARSAEEFADLRSDVDALDGLFAAARADLDEAQAELADAVAASDEAMARAATAEHGRHRFAARVADIESAVAEHARTDSDTEPVRYLSRLTRGMAGRRRVALTTFVLRRWFEHVVQAANVRLALISSGRYELVRVDEGVGRAERTGLTLQVIDRHTGEARSARSLSGGETFYTSLALALGLADVVRAEAGGIDLDTLFIDEGFGSLDAQTLDEVMAVIEDLRDRGRVVGIVSHVTDLKELIHERIEVRRLADGSSTLRVVA